MHKEALLIFLHSAKAYLKVHSFSVIERKYFVRIQQFIETEIHNTPLHQPLTVKQKQTLFSLAYYDYFIFRKSKLRETLFDFLCEHSAEFIFFIDSSEPGFTAAKISKGYFLLQTQIEKKNHRVLKLTVGILRDNQVYNKRWRKYLLANQNKLEPLSDALLTFHFIKDPKKLISYFYSLDDFVNFYIKMGNLINIIFMDFFYLKLPVKLFIQSTTQLPKNQSVALARTWRLLADNHLFSAFGKRLITSDLLKHICEINESFEILQRRKMLHTEMLREVLRHPTMTRLIIILFDKGYVEKKEILTLSTQVVLKALKAITGLLEIIDNRYENLSRDEKRNLYRLALSPELTVDKLLLTANHVLTTHPSHLPYPKTKLLFLYPDRQEFIVLLCQNDFLPENDFFYYLKWGSKKQCEFATFLYKKMSMQTCWAHYSQKVKQNLFQYFLRHPENIYSKFVVLKKLVEINYPFTEERHYNYFFNNSTIFDFRGEFVNIKQNRCNRKITKLLDQHTFPYSSTLKDRYLSRGMCYGYGVLFLLSHLKKLTDSESLTFLDYNWFATCLSVLTLWDDKNIFPQDLFQSLRINKFITLVYDLQTPKNKIPECPQENFKTVVSYFFGYKALLEFSITACCSQSSWETILSQITRPDRIILISSHNHLSALYAKEVGKFMYYDSNNSKFTTYSIDFKQLSLQIERSFKPNASLSFRVYNIEQARLTDYPCTHSLLSSHSKYSVENHISLLWLAQHSYDKASAEYYFKKLSTQQVRLNIYSILDKLYRNHLKESYAQFIDLLLARHSTDGLMYFLGAQSNKLCNRMFIENDLFYLKYLLKLPINLMGKIYFGFSFLEYTILTGNTNAARVILQHLKKFEPDTQFIASLSRSKIKKATIPLLEPYFSKTIKNELLAKQLKNTLPLLELGLVMNNENLQLLVKHCDARIITAVLLLVQKQGRLRDYSYRIWQYFNTLSCLQDEVIQKFVIVTTLLYEKNVKTPVTLDSFIPRKLINTPKRVSPSQQATLNSPLTDIASGKNVVTRATIPANPATMSVMISAPFRPNRLSRFFSLPCTEETLQLNQAQTNRTFLNNYKRL